MATPLYYYETLESTQDEAFRLLENNTEAPFVVCAEEQTKGRGRRARPWHSEKGRSLLFSYATRLNQALSSGLSLVIGLSLAKCLDQPLFLKWPNDLILNDQKVGGILVESRSSQAKTDLVIGVGLNLFSQQFENYAGLEAKFTIEKLLPTLERDLSLFLREGFRPFKADYEKRMWRLHQKIKFQLDEESKEILMVGVGDCGELLSKEGEELRMDIHGEIALEPLA